MGYRVIRALARLLLGLFYRRIEVVGSEHIPARGPVIITANHHNSLVDPMLVMMAAPRPLVILAAAPLFRNPLIGPFLRLVGALPVLRRQEGVGDPGRNDAMFGAVPAALQGGEAPASAAEETARVTGIQQVARAYRRVQQRAPERLAALRLRVETYSKDLELTGATDRELSSSYPPGVVVRWAVREGLSLLLG